LLLGNKYSSFAIFGRVSGLTNMLFCALAIHFIVFLSLSLVANCMLCCFSHTWR